MAIKSGKHLGAARTYVQWNTNIESEPNWFWGDSNTKVTLTLEQVDELAQAVRNKLEESE